MWNRSGRKQRIRKRNKKGGTPPPPVKLKYNTMKNTLVLRASLTGGDGKVKQKNVDMKASNTLIEAIKRFEGFRGTAYKCPAGVWTIGYGHTVGVKRGDKMTEGEAERQLRRDLAEYEAFVDKLGVTERQNKFDALVDFAYNLGCDALAGSTLLKKIRACAPNAEVRAEFMRWVYATVAGKKRKLDGLVKRRKWEADRFFNIA